MLPLSSSVSPHQCSNCKSFCHKILADCASLIDSLQHGRLMQLRDGGKGSRWKVAASVKSDGKPRLVSSSTRMCAPYTHLHEETMQPPHMHALLAKTARKSARAAAIKAFAQVQHLFSASLALRLHLGLPLPQTSGARFTADDCPRVISPLPFQTGRTMIISSRGGRACLKNFVTRARGSSDPYRGIFLRFSDDLTTEIGFLCLPRDSYRCNEPPTLSYLMNIRARDIRSNSAVSCYFCLLVPIACITNV